MYIKHTVCLMFMARLGKESGFYVWLIYVFHSESNFLPFFFSNASNVVTKLQVPFFPPKKVKVSTYISFGQKQSNR